MDPIRVVIEVADGVVRVTATRPVEVLLVRYDDLLADAQAEACPVVVNVRRVERLFRAHGGDEAARLDVDRSPFAASAAATPRWTIPKSVIRSRRARCSSHSEGSSTDATAP